MTERISVIVPVYRAVAYVAECVASIAAQDHAPHEVIFVDDHGGDGSVGIATRVAAELGLAARVVEMADHGGAEAARNVGVREATGDLVWFCDADDTADPRFLSTLVRRLRADRSAFAMTRTLVVGADGAYVDEPVAADAVWPGVRVAEAVLRNELRGYLCNKLLPLAFLRERELAEGVLYGDLDAIVALALRSPTVSLCAEPLYRYRAHAASSSRVFSPRTLDLLAQERRVDEILDGDGRVRASVRLRYRYQGVVLPLANMAARAGGSASRDALATAAARVRARDLVRLTFAGEWRLAAPAAVLRLSRRLYAAILRRR